MAQPVYSELIASQHEADGQVEYIVELDPAYIWVVRDIDAFIAGVGGGAIDVFDGNGVTFWQDEQASITTGLWMYWRGRQVFPPGSSLHWIFTVLDPFGHGDIRFSGYRLSPP